MDKTATTLKWRNLLSKDMPSIFNNTTPHSKNNPYIEYMHVGKYTPLHEEEEHNNTINYDLKLNKIFYKRLHLAIRFSRNLLEHFKDKKKDIKPKYLNLMESGEEVEELVEVDEDKAIKSFTFFHPGLDWILPVFWEIQYRDYISQRITEDNLKTLSIY